MIIRKAASDLDLISGSVSGSVSGWSLDFMQLSPGRHISDNLFAKCGDFLFSDSTFGPKMRHRGAPPVRCRSFALAAAPKQELVWRGRTLSESELLVYPEWSEFDCFTRENCNIRTLTVPLDWFERRMEEEQIRGRERITSRTDVIRLPEARMRRLRARFRAVGVLLRDHHESGDCRLLMRLAEELIAAVTEKRADSPATSPDQLRPTLDAVENAADYGASVDELRMAAELERRTFFRFFKKMTGLSPAKYQKYHRLHMVKRDIAGHPDKKLHEIAKQWGFWHMGDLGRDYKSLFGETPSASRERARTGDLP